MPTGATGGTNYQTAFVLQGVTATDLTSANFVPGFNPDGGGVTGQALNGTGAGETLSGTIGDDHLYGLEGNDTLNGNNGNDFLDGGIGNDVLVGGFGADTFVFSSAPGADNIDTITDFGSGADKLWLSNTTGSPFDALSDGPLAANAFDVIGDATAATTDTRIIYDPNTGALSFDADGDGGEASVQLVILANSPLTIAASDIFAGA